MPASRAVCSGHRRNGVDVQHLSLGRTKHRRLALLLFLSLHLCFLPYSWATLSVTETSESITIYLGSGSNVSYLAFAEPSLSQKTVIYAWRYDGLTNPQGSLWTGLDLYNAVHELTAGSPWALSYSTGESGLTTSFSIGSITSRVVNPLANPGPVWTYWIQGGSEYVEFGDVGSFTFSVGNSLIVSPAYWDTRYISNGSYDVWTINSFSYFNVPSDTHYYTDLTGKIQPVTYGTYQGSAPVLKSPPTLISTRILEGDQLEIVFTLVIGGMYQLQVQEGLSANEWQNDEPPFTATTTQKTYTLPMNNPSKRGFFRLARKE
jgi:hypothetical protein